MRMALAESGFLITLLERGKRCMRNAKCACGKRLWWRCWSEKNEACRMPSALAESGFWWKCFRRRGRQVKVCAVLVVEAGNWCCWRCSTGERRWPICMCTVSWRCAKSIGDDGLTIICCWSVMSWTIGSLAASSELAFQNDDLVVEGEFRSWFDGMTSESFFEFL